MKKNVLWFSIITMLVLAIFLIKPVNVKAEEEIESETESVEQIEEEEITFEEFEEKCKEWISEYTGESIAVKIISWAIDAGVLAALFAVVVKYSKYKNTTTGDLIDKFKNEIGEHMKENFNDLSKDEIKSITSKIGELEDSLETIMKVLILAQDSSTKGKAALIDFLGSKTKSEEVKEIAEEVNTALVEEEQTKAEVLEKVEGEYKEIF